MGGGSGYVLPLLTNKSSDGGNKKNNLQVVCQIFCVCEFSIWEMKNVRKSNLLPESIENRKESNLCLQRGHTQSPRDPKTLEQLEKELERHLDLIREGNRHSH